MYSKSSLDYSNSTNPRPDYYSLMPSYYYDVWGGDGDTGATALANWRAAYDYLSVKENRQLNWDKLYYANKSASLQGADAMYWLRAYHDDQLAFSLSSNLNHKLNATDEISLGLNVSTTKGMHYQTLEDLLGATSFHNINNYAVGTYAETGDEVQYDLNNPNQVVNKGDKYAYDYNIIVNKATLWATYATSFMNASRAFLSARITGTSMQRDGKMRNGLFANNSYGKSGTAYFLDGGAKVGLNFNLGKGNNILLGMHLESKAPTARTAFLAPQMNNEFVQNLKPETNLGFELGYTLTTSWLQASLNGYFNQLHDVTEYSMAYNDIDHSFTYISLTGIQKEYYGVELGLNFKVTDWLNVKALGTISEAKYTNNSDVVYMRSDGQKGSDGSYFYKDVCLNKDMREGGTPLTAASIELSYHNSGWFIDLIGNWYDRIYLYYSPIIRYESDFPDLNNDGVREIPDGALDQAKGKGGFMLDASIGKSMFLKKGRSISINLMLSNILNNRKICTGGMEQNRKDLDENGDAIRTYNFKNNPRKFYAFGINGMLNITYKF